MTAAEDQRDIVFLLADPGMEQVVKGFLSREPHQRLDCGRFEFDPDKDIVVAPTRDPGVYGASRGWLQPFERSHRHAVVVIDAAWEDSGSPSAAEIREHITKNLADVWRECVVIVIEPELEAWLMSVNPHLAETFRCPENYRQILADAGFWPEGPVKPPDPKAALDYLRQRHRARAHNAEFGKLAARMSVRQCQDPAFIQLRDQLRAWFPAERP